MAPTEAEALADLVDAVKAEVDEETAILAWAADLEKANATLKAELAAAGVSTDTATAATTAIETSVANIRSSAQRLADAVAAAAPPPPADMAGSPPPA